MHMSGVCSGTVVCGAAVLPDAFARKMRTVHDYENATVLDPPIPLFDPLTAF